MKKVLVLLAGLMWVACAKQASRPGVAFDTAPAIRISVLASGQILVDGKETTMAELDAALTEFKKTGGTAGYYREAAQREPPPQAREVINLLAGKGIPVTFSSKPDFSDYVGADGQSHPRKP